MKIEVVRVKTIQEILALMGEVFPVILEFHGANPEGDSEIMSNPYIICTIAGKDKFWQYVFAENQWSILKDHLEKNNVALWVFHPNQEFLLDEAIGPIGVAIIMEEMVMAFKAQAKGSWDHITFLSPAYAAKCWGMSFVSGQQTKRIQDKLDKSILYALIVSTNRRVPVRIGNFTTTIKV